MTLVSLDATEDTLISAGGFERPDRAEARVAHDRQGIISFRMDFYSLPFGKRSCAVHPALTLDLVANPDLILDIEYSPIRIEPGTGLSSGKAVAETTRAKVVGQSRLDDCTGISPDQEHRPPRPRRELTVRHVFSRKAALEGNPVEERRVSNVGHKLQTLGSRLDRR